MKTRFVAAMGMMLAVTGCEAGTSGGFGSILNGLSQIAGQSGLTNAEIDAGLRQALEIGTNNVTGQLGAADGFFADEQVRIPLPGRLGDVQSQLSRVGLSGPLDDLELRMNRAASAAMPEARRLVVDAVKSITLEDALGILQGGDTAATDFLRQRTELNLRNAFTPFIDQALGDAGAFRALDDAATRYSLNSVSSSLRGEMTDHAVNLGLNGLFFYVAEEERKIRQDPVARTTDLLRRVFGSGV